MNERRYHSINSDNRLRITPKGRIAAAVTGLAIVAPSLAAVVEKTQGTTYVVVQSGDKGADVVCRGQEVIARNNPHIDPKDPSCIAGGAALDAETGGLYAGHKVQVEVTTNYYGGRQAATGLPFGSRTK